MASLGDFFFFELKQSHVWITRPCPSQNLHSLSSLPQLAESCHNWNHRCDKPLSLCLPRFPYLPRHSALARNFSSKKHSANASGAVSLSRNPNWLARKLNICSLWETFFYNDRINISEKQMNWEGKMAMFSKSLFKVIKIKEKLWWNRKLNFLIYFTQELQYYS